MLWPRRGAGGLPSTAVSRKLTSSFQLRSSLATVAVRALQGSGAVAVSPSRHRTRISSRPRCCPGKTWGSRALASQLDTYRAKAEVAEALKITWEDVDQERPAAEIDRARRAGARGIAIPMLPGPAALAA